MKDRKEEIPHGRNQRMRAYWLLGCRGRREHSLLTAVYMLYTHSWALVHTAWH